MAKNNLVSISGWMKPPRKGLKVGDLVDGNPITEFYSDGDIKIMYLSGIIALAGAIKDMGALIKLDISNNQIGAAQERDLQRICVAGGIELAK
jgi:hypothetical protein